MSRMSGGMAATIAGLVMMVVILGATVIAVVNAPQPVAEIQGEKVCVPKLNFTLTLAPPLETPLQKWKRTKADWEKVSGVVDLTDAQLRQQTWPALEAYNNAEKGLQTAECGKVCVPEKAK